MLAADNNRELCLLCIKAHAAILLGLAAIAQAQDQYLACGWITFIMRFKSVWPLQASIDVYLMMGGVCDRICCGEREAAALPILYVSVFNLAFVLNIEQRPCYS